MSRSGMTVEILGASRLRGRLEDLSDEIVQALQKAVKKSAEAVASDTRRDVAKNMGNTEVDIKYTGEQDLNATVGWHDPEDYYAGPGGRYPTRPRAARARPRPGSGAGPVPGAAGRGGTAGAAVTTAPETTGPIQRALHAVLSGDEPLADLIAGVYDYLPEDVDYPFVVIGEAIETPDNSHDRFGRQTVITLHTWDEYRGYFRVQRIGARLVALLDHRRHHRRPGPRRHRFEFGQTLTDRRRPATSPPGLAYRVVTEQPPTP
ncbi:hypothetical protein SMICM304S_06791 [Streptomyces microflavus]